VKFHDGSDFNADAVVWNVRKVLDREAPHYDPRQVGLTAVADADAARAEKIDDLTVALVTSEPDSLLPINLTNLFMASPAHWEKLRREAPNAEAAWNAFAANPSGTGPFRLTRFVARQRVEMARNDNYWGEKAKAGRDPPHPDPGGQRAHRALLSARWTGSRRRRRTRCRSSAPAAWRSPRTCSRTSGRGSPASWATAR
jgi:ABC-type transport system substrate-binding protein